MYEQYTIIRILEKSTPLENGCIIYKETAHKYGLVSVTIEGKRKSIPAHRAMYMAVNSCFDMPSSEVVRHKCDNPRCVNIDHLHLGTQKDNMQDCIERKRRATVYKPHTRQRTVSPKIVEAIRNAIGKQSHIAEQYGVSVSYVSKVKSGKLKKK